MDSIIVACTSCGRKNRISADKQHLRPKCGHCGAPISLKELAVPVELDDHNFHDFIKQASLPVMVDFFSPTCGPCQMMAPVVQALAPKNINKIIVAKLDTSRNPQTASFFNIRGVPSFLFFKNGGLVDQIAGAVPEAVLEQKISSLV
jgi:thioredoxin 2